MIAPKDFRTTIGQSDKGVCVRVVHAPTGNEITVDPVEGEPVGMVVRRLIAELMGRVFNPMDFVVEFIRAKPRGYKRVIHLSSGKFRDSDPAGKKTVRDLQDELLNEMRTGELAQEKD